MRFELNWLGRSAGHMVDRERSFRESKEAQSTREGLLRTGVERRKGNATLFWGIQKSRNSDKEKYVISLKD